MSIDMICDAVRQLGVALQNEGVELTSIGVSDPDILTYLARQQAGFESQPHIRSIVGVPLVKRATKEPTQ